MILDLLAQAFPNVDVTQGLTFYQKANAWFTGKGRTKEDRKQITKLGHARQLEAMGLLGVILPIVTQNPKFEIKELQEKLQVVASYYREKAPPQLMREIFGLILIDLGKILA
jgi:hypothetical protein